MKNILKDKPLPDQVVYIKSGRLVKYGTVVSVIDAIREAGFDRIGLVAEKEKRRPAAVARRSVNRNRLHRVALDAAPVTGASRSGL